MTPSVRIILLTLIATLVFGVWGVTVLLDESGRRRALWEETVGARATGSERIKLMERRLAGRGPLGALARRMTTAGVSWSPLLTVTAIAGAMLVVMIGGRPLLGRVASTILALMLPLVFWQWLSRRRAKRKENFIAQLPELARVVANGNSAGLSIGRCLAMAGRELAEPAGAEMRQVAQRLDLGVSLDRALHELAERLPSREIDVLVRTIVIQSRTGGALSDALTDISQTLEDRKELRREVGTVILGASVAGYTVMGIGMGAIVLLNMIQPGLLDEMAGSMVGRIIMLVAAAFFAVGFVLMRAVSRVEV
ncbi:type II secretion system F family protein [Actinomyces sp.]|uniref:type II secretion system F family protein n=1 Tax=Actinomyces sp. TaxID=29317 RepID=UPI0026DAC080|nr:type II secretion system F family protein [Actinomyces sp.]MDO4901216.1 type II secretion system F family protein [Actinomyces sp.]